MKSKNKKFREKNRIKEMEKNKICSGATVKRPVYD